MLTGLIILNYNTYEETISCVTSIQKYTTVSYQIYLIDNASPDHSGQKLKALYQNESTVKIILSENNLGFSGGNNLGILCALSDGCDVIYFLNSDITLTNDCIRFMNQKLEEDLNISAVGPNTVYPDGSRSQFARKPLVLSSYLFEKKPFSVLFQKKCHTLREYDYGADKDFLFPGMCAGCFFGLRRDFIQKHNLLDDTIFMFYEEDTLAHLIQSDRKSCCIVSAAHAVHVEGKSVEKTKGGRLLFTRMYRWPSSLYVLWKYAGVSKTLCKLLAFNDKIIWRIIGIKKRTYKESYGNFSKELKRLLNS